MANQHNKQAWNRPVRTQATQPPDPTAEELIGTVESIVFHSEENGYTVCRILTAGRRDPATVVGTCATIWEGQTLKATGKWIRHRQHGYQFQAESLVCVTPTSAQGIERFLAGGLIRGIGKVYAKRLVKHFGTDTLHIIEKESQRLEEVDGIGPARRRKIKASWNEQQGVRDIMIFLQSHGVGTAQASRIYRQYGDKSIALISENPYRLCDEVWGIGFKTADKVARSIGIPAESKVRARAGLIYVLGEMTDEGHCFSLGPELLLHAQKLLDIPVEILSPALEDEIASRRLIRDDDKIYLADLHLAETAIANRLQALLAAPFPFRPIQADKAVPWAEQRMELTFAPLQQQALNTAFTSKVSIITGGPGVGKTTIIRALADVFCARKLKLELAAPTGRAAKRMEEATGHEARTIHRLLKFNPAIGRFEFNALNPLDLDVVILDEVSMMDVHLAGAFLQALPDSAVLVLVGDTDQLPSVGPGNLLRDMIDSGRIPVTALNRIFRQETSGYIVRNAHHVNRGEELELPPPGTLSDFYFLSCDDTDTVIQRMLDLLTERIPRRFGLNPLQDVQVLTPMRRNQLGADNLNSVIQERINPTGAAIERFGRKYRAGDRVMQIRNNYDRQVYNGDIGHILSIDLEEQEIAVELDGRKVVYGFSDLDELVHAYACSIHKSQGSEYPAVIILLTTQHFKLLQRNLLYTAITRGRRLVCVIGSKKAIWLAIRNNEILLRRTSLRERLQQTCRMPPARSPNGT